MRIPLGLGSWERSLAQAPDVRLVNRYYEEDPTKQDDQVALLTRPSLRKWLEIGDGPIRAVYSQPGFASDALFSVSATHLFRIDTDETDTDVGAIAATTLGNVSMAATDENLYIASGGPLYRYTDNARASGTLTASGAIANNDVVEIGGTYYKWTNASVDTGTPAGTVGDPWLVALGASNTEALQNLADAIDDTGTPGTDYSTLLTEHASVSTVSVTSTTLLVRADEKGTGGNAISTTDPTGANIAWGAATLAGGGSAVLATVATPDNVGIVSVGHIAQYVICVVAEGYEMNGRFYWIEPGEITIDPLNFATAERAPDPCWSVRVIGDHFMLPGTGTTEDWYPTGDPAAPFQRSQGRLFDRGVWEGTDVQVKDDIVLVDTDAVVYRITGGGPQRISDNSIEQRIREAMAEQKLLGL